MLFFSRRMPASFPLSLLLVLASLTFFLQLGHPRLDNGFEPRFARGAVELQTRGDWIPPTFNGVALPHDPPLPYWLTIGAQTLWGQNEFAVRSWGAMASIGTVVVTFLLAHRLFGPSVAAWSGIVLVTCLGFVSQGRAAHPISLATLFITAAMYLCVRLFRWDGSSRQADSPEPLEFSLSDETDSIQNVAAHHRQIHHNSTCDQEASPRDWGVSPAPREKLSGWQSVWLFGLLGIAILATGWIGLLIPAITWLIWLTIMVRTYPGETMLVMPSESAEAEGENGESSSACPDSAAYPRGESSTAGENFPAGWGDAAGSAVLLLRPVWALVGLLLVTAPWYLCLSWRTESLGWIPFPLRDMGTWGNTPDATSLVALGARLSNLLIGFFPWSFVLCALGWHLIQHWGKRRMRNVGLQLGICWFATASGLYLIGAGPAADSSLLDGAMVCYPPLALLAAYFLVHVCGASRVWPFGERRMALAWIPAIGLAIAIGFPLAQRTLVLEGSSDWHFAALLGLFVGAAFMSTNALRRADAEKMVSHGAVLATLMFGLLVFRVEPVARIDPLPAAILARTQTPDVATYGVCEPSLVYYLGRPLRQLEVGTVSATGKSGFLLNRGDSPSVDEFLGQGTDRFVVTSRRHLAEIGRLSSAPLEVIAELPRSRGQETLLVLSWRDPQTARKVFPSTAVIRRR